MSVKYKEITKDILIILAAAGLLTIAATSPYFLINLARWIIKNKKFSSKYKNYNIRKISRYLSGLNKNKIIILRVDGDKFSVKITEKGRKIVKKIEFADMRIEKPKIWDKKWRIVIFDIPENKNRIGRDALRNKLKILKFYQIQKSVWVYPFPCEKEIQLMCEVFEVNPYVNIVTAENIYNDDSIKEYFNIK